MNNSITQSLVEQVPALNALPEKALEDLASVTVNFGGPLPPPALLEQYEKIVPGLADRMVAMVEDELKHGHNMDRLQLTSDHSYRSLGQALAFGICVCSLLLAGAFAWLGYPEYGATFGGATLAALAAAFLIGQRKRND